MNKQPVPATVRAFLYLLPIFLLLATMLPSAAMLPLRLDCPCRIETTTPTSISVTAGIVNDRSTRSNDLRLQVVARSGSDFFFVLGFIYLPQPLASGDRYENRRRTTGFIAPHADGDHHITILLQEFDDEFDNWTNIDFAHVFQTFDLTITPGAVVSEPEPKIDTTVYINGTATLEQGINNRATLIIPGIVNNSLTHTVGPLEFVVQQYDTPTPFGRGFPAQRMPLTFPGGRQGIILPPQGRLGALRQPFDFHEEDAEGFDYFVLLLFDTNITLDSFPERGRMGDLPDLTAWQVTRVRNGRLPQRNIRGEALAASADSDSDGISDLDEGMFGSDPADADDQPPAPIIDILALHTPDVAEYYDGDIAARLAHIEAVANQTYMDSGVDLRIRFVGTPVEVRGISPSLTNTELLGMMDEARSDGPFEDLQDLKREVGADLAITYRITPDNGGTNCGVANLLNVGSADNFLLDSESARANSAIYADCRDITTTHEIGHLMGLGHSRLDTESTPALPWGYGHGVDRTFVTVMAYALNFGNARELNLHSSPHLNCLDLPCGVATDTDGTGGIDAVAALQATRFQVAAFTPRVIPFNHSPTLALVGDASIYLRQGDRFDDPGVTARDAEDGALDNNVSVDGRVNGNRAGRYRLRYQVTDSDGDMAEVTREVTVLADAGGDGLVDGARLLPASGASITGRFNNENDLHLYRFNVVAGRSYSIGTEGPESTDGADSHIALAVIGTDLQIRAEGDDQLEFAATDNGTLLLAVQGRAGQGGVVGDYSVGIDEDTGVAANPRVQLAAAVLPGSRSVAAGTTATVLATLLNQGSTEARNCTIAADTDLPAVFFFQTTDPLGNALTGERDAPVDIGSGEGRSFVIGITPTETIDPVTVALRFACDNAAAAPVVAGLNTLHLVASDPAPPDIIALAASANGYVDLQHDSRAGAFAAATVNVGSTADLQVTADTGDRQLPLRIVLCQTDPATAECLAPPQTPPLTVAIDNGATPTFAVFVTASASIADNPARHRVFLRFVDQQGILRGATSVAVRTPPTIPVETE